MVQTTCPVWNCIPLVVFFSLPVVERWMGTFYWFGCFNWICCSDAIKKKIGPSNQPLGSLNGTMGQVGGAGSMGSGGAGPSHTHPHPHTPSPPHPSAAPPHSQHSASMSPKSFHFEGLLTGASNSGTLPDLFGWIGRLQPPTPSA